MDTIQGYLVVILFTGLTLAASFWYFSNKKEEIKALDKLNWRKFKLIKKTLISPNTAIYKFEIPGKSVGLNLPIGQHVSIRALIDGKEVVRSYTPTSLHDDFGFFELIVKSYPNGALSKHFSELKIEDHVEARGPKGNFLYQPNMCKHIGMIAGGTGITPMLQIIRAILRNPKDNTKINLIFANVNYEDILLKDKLDDLAKDHENFNVYYVLNNPPEIWNGGVGFVSEEMIKKHLPPPGDKIKILLCGPPPMIKAMQSICENLGYEKARPLSKPDDMIFKF